MAEANPARRGVMTGSFITGRCARLWRAGRRRVSVASAIIVAAGLLVTWGTVTPAAAATKLAVKTTALSVATAGTSYSAKLAASGGTAPYTWSVTSGALPAGLTLVPTTGLIAGIPAAGSTASFTVQVSDSENPSASASSGTLSITVNTAPLMINTASLPAATADVSYSAKLAVAGGIKPYTWSVTNGALPAGLSLNPATGAISGKPTAPGTAVFRVNVSDAENPSVSASQGLNIAVTVAPLAITTVSVLPGLTSGMPYSVKLAADGGLTPYTWSITQGSLPAGLKLHAATGVISGTPTSGSGSTFTAEVSDAQNPPATASATFSLSANTVTVSSLGDQTTIAGTAVSLQIAASDSAAGQALTYSATGLPAGLSISSSGLISGTPTTPGPYNVTVTATDGTGASGSATFTWTVNPAANTVTVTNPGPQTTIQNGEVILQIAASDSAAGQALTYSATGLPPLLSISSSGQITGLAVTGTFDVTVTATDGTGASGSATFTWTVNPGTVTVTSPGNQTTIAGTAVSLQLAASDTAATSAQFDWAATGLPAGLSIGNSGLISGTPTTPGTYNVTVTTLGFSPPDGYGTATFTWTVSAANTVTVTNPGPQQTFTSPDPEASLQIMASDSAAGQTLTYSATGLPPEWSISPTGLISGLAITGTGTFNVTVTATDGTGASGSAAFTWTVSPPSVSGLAAGGSGRPR
jgi:hypothetical protein